MPQATFHFPRGFLWGTATSAHQVEGNNTNNNWWQWEQQKGRILQGDKSGLACDWWNGRWREDFDRAASAGQNAHRLSVEWSRIQPAPDRWDESALDYYRQMLRGLRERNMTAMVTLHHFTHPIWVEERGGWENPDIVEQFAKFVRKTVEALREYASLWVTINEPNGVAVLAYLLGLWPPGKQDLRTAMNAQTMMIRAHAAAYRAIHSEQPTARVGFGLNYRGFVPAHTRSPLDRMAASMQSRTFNEFFPNAVVHGVLRYPGITLRIPEVKGTLDFLGLQYYTQDHVAFSLSHASQLFGRRYFPPGSDLSPTGFFANEPAGMFEMVKWARAFNVPLIITENGIEDALDQLRPRFLIQHLHQLWRAVNFNWPVKGYFHWTLVDNFEWERGWTHRFGLWELDRETQARRKRPSADLYAEICKENGLSSEMVARYAPEALEKIFPG